MNRGMYDNTSATAGSSEGLDHRESWEKKSVAVGLQPAYNCEIIHTQGFTDSACDDMDNFTFNV